MNRFFAYFTILWTIFLVTNACPANAYQDPPEFISGYVTLLDEQNNIVMQTGLSVHKGDEFISEDNRVYQVLSVNGTTANCRYVRTEILLTQSASVMPVQAAADPNTPLVAIYHTHTDEAYIPTDGAASIPGKGSIIQVGQAFADRLTALGIRTEHNTTPHDPHDANAYQRSRRTLMELLNHQPAALFDIHRDSVPAFIYNTRVNGQDATKILLVVGRQNQSEQTTLSYAKSIKAAADQKYKNLIRGIFIAHGNYNQDLSPRAILAEIGTEENSLDQAQRSAALFADIIPSILAASKPPTITQADTPLQPAGTTGDMSPPPYGRGILQDIGFMVGSVILGSAAFLFLSTGSWREAKDKLRKLKDIEFGDFIRFRRKRR